MFTKLSRTTCNSPGDLVEYWEQFYEDSKQHPDSEFLRHLKWKGGKLTADDIRYLFGWKYRPVPSWDPRPVIKRLRQLNELRFKEGPSVIEFGKASFERGSSQALLHMSHHKPVQISGMGSVRAQGTSSDLWSWR